MVIRQNPTVKYPMTVDELNEALQDPTQSTLTTAVLWLAQCVSEGIGIKIPRGEAPPIHEQRWD